MVYQKCRQWQCVSSARDQEERYNNTYYGVYSQAQFIVAIHYAMGLEVDGIDRIKAKSYLEESAKQGFVHSETALGILHLEDDEYDRALMWLERAEQKV